MKRISIVYIEDSATEFTEAVPNGDFVYDLDSSTLFRLNEKAEIGDTLDDLNISSIILSPKSVGIDELKGYLVDSVDLGSVSGTVTINQDAACLFKATITASTTFNITNKKIAIPLVIIPTGEYTINTPTSSGVTFHYITLDSYVSGKSRLWIMFTDATNADWFYKNID